LFKADREELELGLVLKECLESTGKAHSFLFIFRPIIPHYPVSSKMFNGIRESIFSGTHFVSSSSDLGTVFGVS
jgi:hypothetical protein